MEYNEQLNKHTKDLLLLGYIDFKADLVMCLLREIDRCHEKLAKLDAGKAMSKALINRLENRKPEGDQS